MSISKFIIVSIQKKQRIMLHLENISNKLYSDHQKKQNFLKDPKSDIFLILNDRIFPLHKIIIDQCLYFQNNLFAKQKVHIIDENFDIQSFQKVMGCLYGYPLQFVRNSQIFKILEIVMFLDIHKLKSYFQQDFDSKFQQYGVILLYRIAKKYQLEWLELKCLKDLVSDKFQQLHINKFDLMTTDKQIFGHLLKQHQIMKSKGFILGIDNKTLKNIIEEYGSLNSTLVDVEEVLSISAQDQEEADRFIPYIKQQKKTKIRKRKSTWDHTSEKIEPMDPPKIRQYKRMQSEDVRNLPAKQKQIEDLKKINNGLIKSYNSMFDDIKSTEQITQFSDASSNVSKLETIGKSLQEIETIFEQQKQKIGRAKQIIRQISFDY